MPQIFDAVTTTSLSVDGINVTAHKTRHEFGGADALNLVGLAGVLADPQKVSLQDEGTLVNSRPTINFVGAGVTVSDDGGNSRINVTIPGGVTVQENGSTVEAAAVILNYQNGVIATSGGANIANLNVDYGTSTQPLGTAAAGTATAVSRSDHVHAHGNQAGGTLHPVVTTSVAGFMSAADKIKLNNLNPGVVTQASFTERTTLFSTTSATYVAFMTSTFTSSASAAFIQVQFSAGNQNSNSAGINYYGIYINTVFQRSIGVRVSAASQPQSATIMYRFAVAASTSTTVEIRARTSGGTLSIDPFDGITGTDGHHASLLITEISS